MAHSAESRITNGHAHLHTVETPPALTEQEKYLIGIQDTGVEITYQRYHYDILARRPEYHRFQSYLADKLSDRSDRASYPRLSAWIDEWMAAEHNELPVEKTAVTDVQLKALIAEYGAVPMARVILQITEQRRQRERRLPDELNGRIATLTGLLQVIDSNIRVHAHHAQTNEFLDIIQPALLPIIEYAVIDNAEIIAALKNRYIPPHAGVTRS